MTRLPTIYIYLDVPGIDSLYAQTVDELVLETSRSSKSGRGGTLSNKIGIGGALLSSEERNDDVDR
jgi:hypothetical protein